MHKIFMAAAAVMVLGFSTGAAWAGQNTSRECPASFVEIKNNKQRGPATPASANPAGFADLVEVVRETVGKPVGSTIWEVDTNSIVEVNLFAKGIAPSNTDLSKITVAVTLYKSDATTDFPINQGWVPCSADIILGPKIDLNDGKIQDKDIVAVKITNTAAAGNPSVTYALTRKELGWHRSVSDTVSFVQRRGVSKGDAANGVVKINFAPTPGVTLATVYEPRRDGNANLLRFLTPGFGITASFLDWKDQNVAVDTSDPSKPVFPTGTKSSDINLGLGVQASFFHGQISFLYGWNLQTTGPRQYLGIGISFVNVYQYINDAISSAKTTSTANSVATSSP